MIVDDNENGYGGEKKQSFIVIIYLDYFHRIYFKNQRFRLDFKVTLSCTFFTVIIAFVFITENIYYIYTVANREGDSGWLNDTNLL